MTERVLLFSLLTGVFPFYLRNDKKIPVEFSKFGFVTNLCCCVFLLYELSILCSSVVESIGHESSSSDIKLVIKIANTTFLLIILIRRLAGFKNEVFVLNKIFKKFQEVNISWRKNYAKVCVIFVIELCEMMIEYGIFCYVELNRNDTSTLYTYDLTLLIRLGFEILTLILLTNKHQLYVSLNNFIRFDALKNSLSVHNLRVKLDDLHELRILMNNCYSLDLMLYFISVQLLMLLECFDLVKLFSNYDNYEPAKMTLRVLRIMRLFSLVAYIIWKWCAISAEAYKALEYLFEYDTNKFSHYASYQLELLLEDIQTRNKLFSAHKLYDINMPLLYNICGTIFAYLILIITSSPTQ